LEPFIPLARGEEVVKFVVIAWFGHFTDFISGLRLGCDCDNFVFTVPFYGSTKGFWDKSYRDKSPASCNNRWSIKLDFFTIDLAVFIPTTSEISVPCFFITTMRSFSIQSTLASRLRKWILWYHCSWVAVNERCWSVKLTFSPFTTTVMFALAWKSTESKKQGCTAPWITAFLPYNQLLRVECLSIVKPEISAAFGNRPLSKLYYK